MPQGEKNTELYSATSRTELSLPCGVVDRISHFFVCGVSVTHWSCIFCQKIEYGDIVLSFSPRLYFAGTTVVQKAGNRYSAIVQVPDVLRYCPRLSYFGTQIPKSLFLWYLFVVEEPNNQYLHAVQEAGTQLLQVAIFV
jgi:hypothetical protein